MKNNINPKTFEKELKVSDFEAIKIRLASPSEILSWSHGEVLKPETINYRTQKPEKDGLFSERIFGPVKDYTCSCGKYRGIRYKGIVCDKCGVEITRSRVRRERMGHIKLAAPVAHIWYLRNIPSRLGLVLDIPLPALEKVVYYTAYIIIKVDEEEKKRLLEEVDKEYKNKIKNASKEEKEELAKARLLARQELESLKVKTVLSEADFYRLSQKYGSVFEAATGSEPLVKLLSEMDLDKAIKELEEKLAKTSPVNRRKYSRRLKLLRSMAKAGVRPEWMFLTVLPVLPPELRPMVALDGGRYAASDLNDLYRRVINRNNRLKKLLELKAPEVIIRNEKRMLQEAVDALLDNSIRRTQGSVPMQAAQHRPLRSLADILKGKQGRFRQNLLGKRVDYSGRSVIVVGPELRLDECGVPKKMALEIFKPFIIRELIKREIVFNPRAANRLIEEGTDIVWSILEEVTKDYYVLLNRAPTLHRLSIEAFKPTLIEGLAIQIPPLVCQPFNADFDGDMMAIHLPLSEEAQAECRELMLSSLGILKPANGEPVMTPRLDMVWGIYYLTMALEGTKGEGRHFDSIKDALWAYENGQIHLCARIKVRSLKGEDKKLEKESTTTTVGRLIFNNILPENFPYINEALTAKALRQIVSQLVEKYGFIKTAEILNKIQELGFNYATQSGLSWGIDDLKIPQEKAEIIKESLTEAQLVEKQYEEGLLTFKERYHRLIQIWEHAVVKISNIVPKIYEKTNPVLITMESGARGKNWSAVVQMSAMKGLVVNPAGETIELPILSSYKEGLNILEYFIASHGGRKGLADTALKTAEAGYLTRRLVDVSHEIVVEEEDCGTTTGLTISKKEKEEAGYKFSSAIWGRILAEDVKDAKGNIIMKKGEMISRAKAEELEKMGIEEVKVRSPLTCKSRYGICQKCYGWDLARNELIKVGEAVGIIAAQAIGEPGTQLTLSTKHTGGVSTALDITQGLPRVEELLEARPPKGEAIISEVNGEIIAIEEEGNERVIKIKPENMAKKLKKAKKSRKEKNKNEIIEYRLPKTTALWVKVGDKVQTGDQLCEGSLNLKTLLRLAGKERTQQYILNEVKRVYEIAGEIIHDKHFEVIIRQMFSRVQIVSPGDSDFITNEIVDKNTYFEENLRLKKKKKEPAKAIQTIMGISKVALTSPSFLSGASFQETSRVLIDASLEGKVDPLRGLKENVIIGRLIPAGTGFRKR